MIRLPSLMLLGTLSLMVWPVEGAIAQPPTAMIAVSAPAIDQSVEQAQLNEDAAVSDRSPEGAVSPDEQVEELLRAAQTLNDQGDLSDALIQIDRATALVKTLPSGEERDRLLSPIGSRLVEMRALDRVEAIAQAMTYDTFGNTVMLRMELEQSLIKAYIQTEQTPQAVQLIQSLNLEGDFYWMVAVEALANQGDVEAAENLFENVKDKENLFFIDVDGNAIAHAYIGAGQFAAAQNFLAQHPVSNSDSSQSYRVAELSLCAGRANQMEAAEAIAQQIPAADRRADTLLELAKLYQARNQIARATDLVGEAAALPQVSSDDPNNDWSTNFSTLSKISLTYASLGQREAARQVLNDANRQRATPMDNEYQNTQWIDAYASIGDFDRASELLAGLADYPLSEGQLAIATAYANEAQYEPALTLLGQISDRLLSNPGDDDPKLSLLKQIVRDAAQQDQFAVAQRAVTMMPAPSDQVLALSAIAAAYQSQQQTQAAVSTLDQALALANTIDSYGVVVSRNDYFELSNAGLLIDIAEGYWAADQQDKAIAAAQLAFQSAQASEGKSFTLDSIEKIAQLGQDWQQPDLRRAALLVVQTQFAAGVEETVQDAEPGLAEPLANEVARLIALANEPDMVPSEVIANGLSGLETMREQTSDPQQQIDILNNLISLYSLNNQPDLARSSFDRALTLIAPLNQELRDDKYNQLALTVDPSSEQLSQVLPLLSSRSRVGTLLSIAEKFAAKDQSTQAVERFEQAMELANTALSVSDRDFNLMNGLRGGYYSSQHTPTKLLLRGQLLQRISDPVLRARLMLELAANLPTSEAQTLYEALPSALAAIPNAFTRRDLLWQAIDDDLGYKQFDRAAQLANLLDGEYRQSALSLIEIARS
ncbi:MAG: hypothetical protein DCF25_06735 [Leptolyngbya foveolarum]|uniref:Uncharacterized protein n=1 Tax=Leptolyngbya foveolarum TaxID=47253 RepID=A0A2W4UIL5_9CYAN|nr:MAG: hypothetical protein DCF25_06735 [Leptolyngbya foveolarum]